MTEYRHRLLVHAYFHKLSPFIHFQHSLYQRSYLILQIVMDRDALLRLSLNTVVEIA